MLIALADIKIPKKIKKRGRPKGIDTTVIGLSKHRKSDKPVPFCKKTPKEKEKGNRLI